MKVAKNRRARILHRTSTLSDLSPKPRYRLTDLMAQMAPGHVELDAEMRAWEDMQAVGLEFGANPVDEMRVSRFNCG